METLISVIIFCFQIVEPFLQPRELFLQPQNRRDVHIFVNIAEFQSFKNKSWLFFNYKALFHENRCKGYLN